MNYLDEDINQHAPPHPCDMHGEDPPSQVACEAKRHGHRLFADRRGATLARQHTVTQFLQQSSSETPLTLLIGPDFDCLEEDTIAKKTMHFPGVKESLTMHRSPYQMTMMAACIHGWGIGWDVVHRLPSVMEQSQGHRARNTFVLPHKLVWKDECSRDRLRRGADGLE